jgi:hypothetical protein
VFKIAVVSILLFILLSLAVAFFSFVTKKADSEKMLKALTIRIALSIGLLIFLMLGAQFGLISPHGI